MGPSTDRYLQAGVRLKIISGALGHPEFYLCLLTLTHMNTLLKEELFKHRSYFDIFRGLSD